MAEYARHHYVPIWYQKRFMPANLTKLHYLNLDPRRVVNGRTVGMREVENWGPRKNFCVDHLYTVKIRGSLEEVYEKFFFGPLDNLASHAIDAVANSVEDEPINRDHFRNFFEFMSFQTLRTPKGLDWIRSVLRASPTQEKVLETLSMLRGMRIAMWMESFQEILHFQGDSAGFLISDSPVTSYNKDCYHGSRECTYPNDPNPKWKGTQTIFPLDSKKCLVLTHSEYAHKQAMKAGLKKDRTNPRLFGGTIGALHQIVHRNISEDDVIKVNRILKLRATRYLASPDPDWLYPEAHCGKVAWPKLGECLMPQTKLWRNTGSVLVGFKDGTVAMRDAFGRSVDGQTAKAEANYLRGVVERAVRKSGNGSARD